MTNKEYSQAREAVAVFDDADTMQDAIDDLLSSGFNRAELSLLASEETVDEKLGHKYQKVAELEDDAAVPRTRYYVSREAISEGEYVFTGGLASPFRPHHATASRRPRREACDPRE